MCSKHEIKKIVSSIDENCWQCLRHICPINNYNTSGQNWFNGKGRQRIVGKERKNVGHDKSYARGSNIAKHAWSSNHSIDFKNSQVVD